MAESGKPVMMGQPDKVQRERKMYPLQPLFAWLIFPFSPAFSFSPCPGCLPILDCGAVCSARFGFDPKLEGVGAPWMVVGAMGPPRRPPPNAFRKIGSG